MYALQYMFITPKTIVIVHKKKWMTKYDVFYLLVLTSNVSSFVCFGTGVSFLTFLRQLFSFVGISTCGVAHIVVCHMFLCVLYHYSFTTFLCDTISMEEELLHSPRLPHSPTWIVPDTLQCAKCVSMMRNVAFLAIRMLAY